jgi:hypothetical protein
VEVSDIRCLASAAFGVDPAMKEQFGRVNRVAVGPSGVAPLPAFREQMTDAPVHLHAHLRGRRRLEHRARLAGSGQRRVRVPKFQEDIAELIEGAPAADWLVVVRQLGGGREIIARSGQERDDLAVAAHISTPVILPVIGDLTGRSSP